jgi:hypothetical protein
LTGKKESAYTGMRHNGQKATEKSIYSIDEMKGTIFIFIAQCKMQTDN